MIGIGEIIVGEDEVLEKAIKRFKRMMEKEGVIREWKKREFYEKPSQRKRRELETARRREWKRRKDSE